MMQRSKLGLFVHMLLFPAHCMDTTCQHGVSLHFTAARSSTLQRRSVLSIVHMLPIPAELIDAAPQH
jgi:predicted regulator of amino acid metabolism with ACT domain